MLSIVLAEPGIGTAAAARRYCPALPASQQPVAALHELLLLERAGLVQRSRRGWSPALFAAETLRADHAADAARLRPAVAPAVGGGILTRFESASPARTQVPGRCPA